MGGDTIKMSLMPQEKVSGNLLSWIHGKEILTAPL